MRATFDDTSHFYDELDFSSYDASVPPWLIDDIFTKILWPMLKMPKRHFQYFKTQFNLIKKYFIYTPFLMKDNLVVKTGGVPSGSYGTNLIDSIARCIVQRVVHKRMQLSDCVSAEKYMGDDSLVCYNMQHMQFNDINETRINAREVEKEVMALKFNTTFVWHAGDIFGMKVNASKTHVSFKGSDTTFLGCTTDEWQRSKLRPSDCLAMLCHPERVDLRENVRFRTTYRGVAGEHKQKTISKQVLWESLGHLFLRISSYCMLTAGCPETHAMLRDLHSFLMVKYVIKEGGDVYAYKKMLELDSPIEEEQEKNRDKIIAMRKKLVRYYERSELALWNMDVNYTNISGSGWLPSAILQNMLAKNTNDPMRVYVPSPSLLNFDMKFELDVKMIRKYCEIFKCDSPV